MLQLENLSTVNWLLQVISYVVYHQEFKLKLNTGLKQIV